MEKKVKINITGKLNYYINGVSFNYSVFRMVTGDQKVEGRDLRRLQKSKRTQENPYKVSKIEFTKNFTGLRICHT